MPPLAVSVVLGYAAFTTPVGNVVVVMVSAALTVIDKEAGADVLPALSLTVTLNAKGLPVAVVGVPLITPVEGFSVKPGGGVPLLTVQLL